MTRAHAPAFASASRATTLLASTLIVALTGCAGPRPHAPASAAITPPTVWRTTAGIEGEVAAEWWRGFGDPALTRIIETALAHNVDIAIAATRVEEARGLFRLAHGQLLPSVGAGVGARRERFLNAFGRETTQTASRAEFSASYELDLFGRLRSSSEAARAALLATETAHHNVRLAITTSAANGYIGLRALDARLAVLEKTLAARAGSLQIAQRRARSGYATQLELEQAEAEYRATEQQIPVILLAISRQEGALSLLLGDNPRAIERGRELSSLIAPPLPGTLPSALLRRRPDIAQAELQIVAADLTLDAARAAFMPRIDLSASGGFADSTLIGDPATLFSLGGSILAPVYQGGRLRAQADVAASRRDQAAFAYRKLALNAFREVEDTLAALQRTGEQEAALRHQRDALARALAQAGNRYRAGYSSYLEELDAQRGLLSAELLLVQVNADRLSAAVNLYQALGGGWSP
jgi:NodT family efflux transporter outer membrane factor (OMF) lipoprotein